MSEIAMILFDDWFPTSNGFVGICSEYCGLAVYEYHSDGNSKRHWFIQKHVARMLYDELRMYLEVSHL